MEDYQKIAIKKVSKSLIPSQIKEIKNQLKQVDLK